MGIGSLFLASSMPVLKLFILTGVGSSLATQRIGILGEDALKHLNNLVFYVFDPAFVYINLSKTMTLQSMISLWFMPVNILITFVVGTILGWALIQITRPPPKLRGLILGCCAGGNQGGLMMIIAPAVCKEKSGPFGDEGVCSRYALLYASLSMAIATFLLWSYVYNVVRISSSGKKKSGIESLNADGTGLSDENSSRLPEIQVSAQDPVNEQLEDQRKPSSPEIDAPNASNKVSISFKFKQHMSNFSEVINLKKVLTPAAIAVVIGYMVGVGTPLRKVLVGENAPLRVIQSSISVLGDADIAAATLIIGGNLTRGANKSGGIGVPIIIGIMVVRYILLPLLGVVVIKGAIRFGLVQRDPLYQFILMLQFTVPPAMSIGIMTQLFGSGEGECSMIFLWTYALAILALTLWSAFFMWLVS